MSSSDTPVADASPNNDDVSLIINAQYIKDFSFENPRGFQSFIKNAETPDIEVSIQVKANTIQDNVHEIQLEIRCQAKDRGNTLFLIDLHYVGLMTITAADPALLNAILFIEAPRLLFPFARSVIADITKDSGFPPLVLAPVNFAALYAQQSEQANNSSNNTDTIQ